MERIAFDAAAVLTIVFAVVMAAHPHPVKSVLALVVSFFGLAACFVLLAAPFVAAIQVIVYAGAILVLFLFVLMLLNVAEEVHQPDARPIQKWLGSIAVLAFAVTLVRVLAEHGSDIPPSLPFDRAAAADIRSLAKLLFNQYLLAFEALSILLLSALVGAFVLARKEKRP